MSQRLWDYVDVNLIDQATYLLAIFVNGLVFIVRTHAERKTQQYALYMALGLVVVMTFVLVGS